MGKRTCLGVQILEQFHRGFKPFFSPIRSLDLLSIDFPPPTILVLLFGSVIIFKFCIGKEKHDHLVKWVEKLSWDCLNKLFEIESIKRKIFVLLIEKNFKCVLDHQRSFVILVFSRFAPFSHVPNKYFLLKDLKVYEVAWLMDIEVRQTCLNAHERKCQEDTLHQASTSISCSTQRKHAKAQEIISIEESFEYEGEE